MDGRKKAHVDEHKEDMKEEKGRKNKYLEDPAF